MNDLIIIISMMFVFVFVCERKMLKVALADKNVIITPKYKPWFHNAQHKLPFV